MLLWRQIVSPRVQLLFKYSVSAHNFRLNYFVKLNGNGTKNFNRCSIKFGGLFAIGCYSLKLPKVLCKEVQPVIQQTRKLRSVNRNVERSSEVISWADVWQLIKPHLGWLLGAVLGAVAAAVVNIQLPLLLGDLVNVLAELKHSGSFESLKPAAINLTLLYLAQSALTFVYISLLSTFGERIATELRYKLFVALTQQDIAFFDAQRTGELTATLSADVQEFKSSFKQCVSQGLRSVTQTIGCVVTLYFISPQMTAVTVTILPGVIILGTVLGSVLRSWSSKAQAQTAYATCVADEAMSNIRTVRAFAMEDVEQMKYLLEAQKAGHMQESLGYGIGLFQGLTNLFLNGIVMLILVGGGHLIVDKQLSPGHLMSFLVTTQTIQRSLGHMSILYGQAIKGFTAGGRVFQIIHLQPNIPIVGGAQIPYHSLVGDVRFNSVTFAYPTRPEQVILQNLNLHLPPGKMVALCGPSGQGKSTLASLLERFYDPLGGSITLDGHDIRSLDPKWLRRKVIGIISQEPVLFATSIRENIRYGKLDATDQEVESVAKKAHVDEFIGKLPNGYDTVVGERGVLMSGGQKQRVAIARALLKDPTILILDEATSALDASSEGIVHDALEEAMRGRTVLIIAHRLSTIKNADTIALVADKGVKEIGTHKELMWKKGDYYKLIQMQMNNNNL